MSFIVRLLESLGPQTSATNYHPQLGHPDKGHAIKGVNCLLDVT